MCVHEWTWYLTDPDYELDSEDVDDWFWVFGELPEGVDATYTAVDTSEIAPGSLLFNLMLQNGDAPELNFNMSLSIGCNCIWLWNWYFLFGTESDGTAQSDDDEDTDAQSPKSVVFSVSDQDEGDEQSSESENAGNGAPAISQANIASAAAEAIATISIDQSIDQSYGDGAAGAYQSALQIFLAQQTAMAAAQTIQHGAANYNSSIGTWVDQVNVAAAAASAITEATVTQDIDQYAGGPDSYHAQYVGQGIGIAQFAGSAGQASQTNSKNTNSSVGGSVNQWAGAIASGSATATTNATQSAVQIQVGAGSAQAGVVGHAAEASAQSAQQDLENENESTDSDVDQSHTASAAAAGIAMAISSQTAVQAEFGSGSTQQQGALQLAVILQAAAAQSLAWQEHAGNANASAGASVEQSWGSDSVATSASVAITDQDMVQYLEGDGAAQVQVGVQQSWIEQAGGAAAGAAAVGEANLTSEATNLNLAVVEQWIYQVVIPFLQIGEPPKEEEENTDSGSDGTAGDSPKKETSKTVVSGPRTIASANTWTVIVETKSYGRDHSGSAAPDSATSGAASAGITEQSIVIVGSTDWSATAGTAGATDGDGNTVADGTSTKVSASTDGSAYATHGPPEEGPWAGDAGEAEEEEPSPPPVYAPAPSGAAASGVADGPPGGTVNDTALMNVGIPALLAWLLSLLVVRRPALYDDKPEEPG